MRGCATEDEGESSMWKYFGTFVNALAVICGGGIGLALRGRGKRAGSASKREPLPGTMMACLGLCTIFAAASGLLSPESGTQAIVVVA